MIFINIILKNIISSFRLLSELYSLLSTVHQCNNILVFSFRLLSELYSLLYKNKYFHHLLYRKFPSPLGVIFSLIRRYYYEKNGISWFVSVSSRSYILSYLTLYLEDIKVKLCFRLLSELYSLLCKLERFWKWLKKLVSVSSRSYILSYTISIVVLLCVAASLFPSPLGVIFSLILYSKNFLFVIVYRAIIVWFFKF